MSDPYALKKSDLSDTMFSFEIMDCFLFFKMDNPDSTLKEACENMEIKENWVKELAQENKDWLDIYDLFDQEPEPKLPRIILK